MRHTGVFPTRSGKHLEKQRTLEFSLLEVESKNAAKEVQ
jgi:hypothetical protein